MSNKLEPLVVWTRGEDAPVCIWESLGDMLGECIAEFFHIADRIINGGVAVVAVFSEYFREIMTVERMPHSLGYAFHSRFLFVNVGVVKAVGSVQPHLFGIAAP